MKLIVTKNYEELSKVAAVEFSKVLLENKQAVLGLATGSSPIGMYNELIEMYKNGELDFSEALSINLDEYIGLSSEHEKSYRYFMNKTLFDHINIDKSRTFVPNGLAKNLEEECKSYDNKIKELGGIDVQILGIGSNGHIAFNEPDNELSVGTSIVNLTENTVEANARFFNSMDEVPKTALTMGLGGIMQAKKIILVASGENKAEAIKGLFSGKITTQNPATVLQMHRDVTIIIDEDAAKLIK